MTDEREKTPTEQQGEQPVEQVPGQEQLEALQRDLEEARSKEQEFRNLLQRVQADFINYRRRVEQERAEHALADKAAILRSILPVLDDFERAVAAMPPELANNEWAQGVALILRKLRNTLELQGVKPIEALGQEFNPWEHEAVLSEAAGPEHVGKVIAVLRAGYKLDGRVIRPAQVKVGV